MILPVLPNHVYGPFGILNPFKIWLMVVLIVGLSLGGYVTYKLIGVRAGAWASGVLGGLISSTATTVSVARRSRQVPGNPEVATFVILMASAVSLLRVGLLVGVTVPPFLPAVALPLGAMLGVLALLGSWSLSRSGNAPTDQPDQANPAELKPAVMFGLLYALILLVVAAANQHFGKQGLYVASVISGLTDMDAITLSVSQLVKNLEVAPGTGWRLIVVAAMANLAFKAGMVVALGEKSLRRRVCFGFGAAAAIGATLLIFGPP